MNLNKEEYTSMYTFTHS